MICLRSSNHSVVVMISPFPIPRSQKPVGAWPVGYFLGAGPPVFERAGLGENERWS